MGPRPRGRGVSQVRTSGSSNFSLQWGRARAGAELNWTAMGCVRSALLQWGRARAGAELLTGDKDSALARKGFNGAAPARARSSRQARRHTRTLRGFNGAAPARARSWIASRVQGCCRGSLQWGRARAGAEFQ